MKKYFKVLTSFIALMILVNTSFASVFAAENDPISFADSRLLNALIVNGADTDNNGIITEGELAQCTQLFLNGYGIENLSGLQYAIGAENLDLSCNSISDLTPLSGLTGLVRLNLAENSISALAPLANLTALTNLYLNDNNITDITALSGMGSLHTLCLQNNSVTNLAPLTGHEQLYYLDLSNNGITSLSGLNDFTALNYLNLNNNSIADITALQNFNGKFLYLSDNRISDISALASTSSVTNLSLNRNDITDIDALSSMELFSLSFSKNTVRNLVSLQSQQNIGSLSMQENYIDTSAYTVGNNIINSMKVKQADFNVSPQKLERLWGNYRTETAISIALSGWNTAENVIIVNSSNFIDSISLAPLAKLLDAPILLTSNPGVGLEYQVSDALANLNAQKIYLVGGYGSINSTIENSLREKYQVERIAGFDRFITCAQIADKVIGLSSQQIDEVFLTNSLTPADAMSISSAASILGIPILYNPSTAQVLEPAIEKFIVDNNISKVTIIGGPGAVPLSIDKQLSDKSITVSRLAGQSRYLTAMFVYENYKNIYDNTKIALSSGSDISFTDILAGVSYASKNRHPLLFIDYNMSLVSFENNVYVDKTPEFKSTVNGKERDKVIVFGGSGKLPETIVADMLW